MLLITNGLLRNLMMKSLDIHGFRRIDRIYFDKKQSLKAILYEYYILR